MISVIALLIMWGVASQSLAQGVEASLSSEGTMVGTPVQLTIQVDGRNANILRKPAVDGLEVVTSGRTAQFNMMNFQMSYKTVFTFVLIPTREGVFEIPPVLVQVDGKNVQTRPLTLRVDSAGSGVSPPALRGYPPQLPPSQLPQGSGGRQDPADANPASPPSDPTKAAFGELLGFGERKFIYAGEVIPVEVRFYFDAEFNTRLVNEFPTLGGEGFTSQRLSNPKQTRQEINGRVYAVVSFRTTLMAVKSGMVEIPSASLKAAIEMPATGANDPFLGNGMFQGIFGDVREVEVKTPPLSIEVRPLPKEGQPADFSGAIGQFSLASRASPLKGEPGDPVTLSVTVTGRGNFDAMGAPHLVDSEGWRVYPPGENFLPSGSDPTGYIGNKVFDFTMVAQKDQAASPAVEFSYFDPVRGKYSTLQAEPVPLVAKAGHGGAEPAATPATATAEPSPEEQAKSAVAGLSADFRPASFKPAFLSAKYLIANAVAAGLWTILLGILVARRISASGRAVRQTARREQRRLLHRMEDPACAEKEFCEMGSRVIALQHPVAPDVSDMEFVGSAPVSAEAREALRGLLERRDELNFSSNGHHTKLGAAERLELIRHLKELHEKVC